jgi:hypothetical protein
MIFLTRSYILTSALILIIAQLCFCQRAASALNQDQDFPVDSTRKVLPASEEELMVDIRIISDDVLDKYKNDPEFNYERIPNEADDWITKVKNWIRQQLIILSSSKTYSTLLDVLYYGLMVVAILLIVRGLIKADRRGLLFGKLKSDEINIVESEEDINTINFDELIARAIDNKQYKLAIRYLFLKSLKLLSEKGLIELRNNKTNYQYINEIKHNQIAEAFRVTTNMFEWIWYGDFPVDEDIVKNSQNDFNKLFALISS